MGSTGLIITIVVIILILGCSVTGVIILAQKGVFSKKSSGKNEPIKFYLRAIDSETRNPITADYILNKNVTLKKGTLQEDFTEIELEKKPLEIFCYSDKYYSSRIRKEFSLTELKNNISKFECSLEKIGTIKPRIKGNLNNENNIITINVSGVGNFNKLGICFSWTPGIIDVSLNTKPTISCDNGLWVNYTELNITTKKYTYLPKDWYRCDDYLEKCEKANHNQCTPFTDIEIPYRFLTQYDKCFYIGKSFKDKESYVFIINVKTLEFKNRLDKLTMTFFDNDLRFVNNNYDFISEIEGDDIASPDLTEVIEYGV